MPFATSTRRRRPISRPHLECRESHDPTHLTTEAVQGAWPESDASETEKEKLTALSLEGVDDVEGGDGLPLGVLSVGDGVADDALEEGLEDTAGLLVDHGGDTLDTTTAGETADGGLGDALDVVAENLAVTLGAALAEALAAFATSRHDE
jgi:hypothetical protein